MSNPGRVAGAVIGDSHPTGAPRHRITIPPPLVGLGQLQLLAPRLRPPPQRRLRITRYRVHLSPRENRAILRQYRKLNRRILAFTEYPAQRLPHPMSPPPGALNDRHRPDTDPRPRSVDLGQPTSSRTQRKPRLDARRILRYRTLCPRDRRRICGAHQPTHRSALPPGLHTTRDLLQPKRHRAKRNNLTQRRHHPRRSPLRPHLPRHTPSMRNHPDNPHPKHLLRRALTKKTNKKNLAWTTSGALPPGSSHPNRPQGAGASGGRGQPRTPAPLRRAGKDHQAGCLLTARTSPARRRAAPRKGHTTLALRTHRPTALQGRREETTSHTTGVRSNTTHAIQAQPIREC
jgi:hypothetical protein